MAAAHGLLLGDQAAAHRYKRGYGAYDTADVHAPNGVFDVFAVEDGPVPPLRVARESEVNLVKRSVDGDGIDSVGRGPRIANREQGDHAVHGSGVNVQVPEGRCEALGERRLAGRGVAVHGDAEGLHRFRV